MHPLTAGTVVQTRQLWDELQASLKDLPVRNLFDNPEVGDIATLHEKVDRMRPEVIFLDISGMRDKVEEVIRGIRSTAAAPTVLALNLKPDPDIILNAMRAGAAEFLYPPFGEQVRVALERIGRERQASSPTARMGGQTIGFVSAKGGCGATTVACHTATELPRQSKGKVLLADLDFDAGMIAFLLKAKSSYNISDAVRNTQRLDENYWRALVSNGVASGLEIITAPAIGSRHALAPEQLRFVVSFARTQYDWTILDLGRSMTASSLGAIDDLDQLFLVTTMDVPALHQAKTIIHKLLECGYGRNRIHLILNRAPKQFDLTMDELESTLGASVYATIPSDDQALNDCYSEGKLLPAGAGLRRNFTQLAMKIAGVTEDLKVKKRFSLFG